MSLESLLLSIANIQLRFQAKHMARSLTHIKVKKDLKSVSIHIFNILKHLCEQ
jgi:hypothetical protein